MRAPVGFCQESLHTLLLIKDTNQATMAPRWSNVWLQKLRETGNTGSFVTKIVPPLCSPPFPRAAPAGGLRPEGTRVSAPVIRGSATGFSPREAEPPTVGGGAAHARSSLTHQHSQFCSVHVWSQGGARGTQHLIRASATHTHIDRA